MSGRRSSLVTPPPRGQGGGRGGGRGRGGRGGRGDGRGRGGRGGRGRDGRGRGGRGGRVVSSRQRDSRLFDISGENNNNRGASAVARSTAPSVATTAAAAMPKIPSDEPEVDPLCVKAQMILLLNKNNSSSNPDSFDLNFAKNLYSALEISRGDVLSIIGEEAPQKLAGATCAFDKPFTNGKKRVGKLHYVEKMVDIWMEVRNVSGVVGDVVGRRQTRTTSLSTYIGTMRKFEQLANTAVDAATEGFRKFKSDPFPPGEADRKWKENHSELPPGEFPQCPCGHKYHDGPASNDTVVSDNEADLAEYMRQCDAFIKWKNGQGPQPRDKDGNLIEKQPTPPKFRKKMFRCHCDQMFADPRSGNKCPIDCTMGGMKLPLGTCMICNCTCNAYFSVDKYRSIMTAISVESYSSENATAGQEAAARLLNDALDVNKMQQSSSLNHYAASQRDGRMSRNADYYSNVSNEGSLAQAFSIVGSQPSAQAIHQLRGRVDAARHPAGPTMTRFGDMRTHGGKRSAAGDRVRNNALAIDLTVRNNALAIDLTGDESPDPLGDSMTGLAEMTDDDLERLATDAAASAPADASVPAGAADVFASAFPPAPSAPAAFPPAAAGTSPLMASYSTAFPTVPATAVAAAAVGNGWTPAPVAATAPIAPIPAAAAMPGTPSYVRRQIQYANEQRQSNRENNGSKKERKRCLQIQKRLTNTSDPLRRDVLERNTHKPTPARHQMCMDLLSDEEDE